MLILQLYGPHWLLGLDFLFFFFTSKPLSSSHISIFPYFHALLRLLHSHCHQTDLCEKLFAFLFLFFFWRIEMEWKKRRRWSRLCEWTKDARCQRLAAAFWFVLWSLAVKQIGTEVKKRKLQLATGRLPCENRTSGHKQQTQPHEHTETVDVPSLNNHLRMD